MIFECVGSEQTVGAAIENAEKGSSIVVVGVFGKKPVMDMAVVQDRELTVAGTLMYQRKDYEESVELIGSGKIETRPLITDHFPFSRYWDAYQHIENAKGRSLKVMIDVA